MNVSPVNERLAVCSWSLCPTDPQDLAAKLRDTGIRRVQLALDPLREAPSHWGAARAVLAQAGVSIVSGMFGCVGEDYSTLDSIRLTGGIAPDATWEENRVRIEAAATLATALQIKVVTFHAGFVPHDSAHPDFAKLVRRVAVVAGIFSAKGIQLGLETGQETAAALVEFLRVVNAPNVGVNFDPANMLLYGKGDPVEAVRMLGPWIRQVHIKDANRTRTPGMWGAEVRTGTGEVDWPDFFAAVAETGFRGNLVIERESGAERIADICTARDLVLKLAG